MNSRPFIAFAFVSFALVVPARLPAALDPAIVSADARWVVYSDLNTLRETLLGKELIAMAEKAQMQTPGGNIGLDWHKLLGTIGSVTGYGTNFSPDPQQVDGTLLVKGTPDLRKIVESLLLQGNLAHPENVVEVTDLPFSAYALRSASNNMEVIVAFPPEPVLLVSKSRAQLLKARDVYRGQAPSLAKNAGSELAKFIPGAAGAYIFSASVAPPESMLPAAAAPQARIFRMANAGSFAIGERGANTVAHAELVASSGQMAEKLMKILQGITAVMSLAETNDKQLADFLNSASVGRKNDIVTLDLAYSSERLATMIHNLPQSQGRTAVGALAAAAHPPAVVNGKSVAEWQSTSGPEDPIPGALAWKAVDNVALKTGTVITLASQNNGGKNVRIQRIEITPMDGSAAPLVFRTDYMRNANGRGNSSQMQFPGANGVYSVKIGYINDPEGKATYAMSSRDPKTSDLAPAAPAEPTSLNAAPASGGK